LHEPRRHRREPNVSLRRLYGRGIADHAIGTHESPEDAGDEDGGITAFHTSELAFCFHALSVPQIHIPTGGGPVAMALQDKVSQAWINFARTGDPNQPFAGLETVHEGNPGGDGVSTPSADRCRCRTTSSSRCCRSSAAAAAPRPRRPAALAEAEGDNSSVGASRRFRTGGHVSGSPGRARSRLSKRLTPRRGPREKPARTRRSVVQQWCVNSASRRMIGIGTPRNHNSIDRMKHSFRRYTTTT
jgi:hypothetical protein